MTISRRTHLLRRLLDDERGVIQPVMYVFLVAVVSIGVIAGLTAVRDSVVQEFGDLSLALQNIDQSYTVNCTINGTVFSFGFVDGAPVADPDGSEPAGIDICLPATQEAFGVGGGGGPLDATPE
ncbi:hypothetical protein [Thalassoroseus pseudoceratinae]|uniref:hypothetical protein n=1 Tax=Thalassoroseus pseudoceratinae TaxID=2713176 RepID=UPI0014225E71|nr:hypothetical protein [Thalassoroseus pseudoceratinae]